MTKIFKNHKSSGRNVEKWMTCNLNLKDIKNGSGFKKGGITIRNKSFLRVHSTQRQISTIEKPKKKAIELDQPINFSR